MISKGRTRTRGDVPLHPQHPLDSASVAPVRAGMCRSQLASLPPAGGRTRTRGDVPKRETDQLNLRDVAPVRAGMCRKGPGLGRARRRRTRTRGDVPHPPEMARVEEEDRTRTRGDVPHDARAAVCPMRSHPCARGCAGRLSHPLAAGMVAPVRAAYLRLVDFVLRRTRTRGDVPFDIMDGRLAVQSHPYARGCAEYRHDRAPR